VERREVKPSTPLEQLFPLAVRRLRWRQVRAAIGLKVPRLQWPTAVAMTVLVIGFATAFAVVKAAGARDVWLGLLTLFGGSFVGTLLLALATPLARAFPTGEVTAGDLAKDVLALNYRAFAGGDGAGNRPEVWESLCRVIVKQTGVEREKITPEARIVYDLGID
jgi:hypothetical protein